VPVSTRDDIYRPLLGLSEVPAIVPNTVLGHQGSVYAHGFAMLRLGSDAVTARYYQNISGKPELIYSEAIS
jgi:hypothetical protein